MTEVEVIGRDGTKQRFETSRLLRKLKKLVDGINTKYVNLELIVEKISNSLPDEVSVDQLVDLTSETLATMSTIHPDHAQLGARLYAEKLQRASASTFSCNIEKLRNYYNKELKRDMPLISEKLFSIVTKHADKLDAIIIPENDLKLTYFAIKTLERAYLLKIDAQVSETPQYMLMRVSLGIHEEDIDAAIETYNLMSNRYFIHASPTLFNSGTPMPYLSSCFLLGITEDSIDGIYKTLHRSAMISKAAGGLGIHVSNVRSTGAYIAGTNGTSNGIVPMLRVYNNTARYVDQGGNKRPGAFAMYLEPWHGDVFEFLSLRKNHGKEELRARDLFYALWIPDLFMEKVKANQDWALFSPDVAPGLNEVYGEEFEKLYNKYVAEGRATRIVRAQKLWYAILEAQTETGGPFMLYKDSCNKKSNQKNLGTIKSSNLCCEIVEYSSPEEVAVCNLASIALPSFVEDEVHSTYYNFTKLHDVVKTVVKNLNKIIDVGAYPIVEAERSNKNHRPIALGVQGLADLFMKLRLAFDSEEAKVLNIQIFETIYHASVEASIELAMKYGPYKSYTGSPASQGLLQFDLWNHKPTDLYDWIELKDKLSKHGLRNSLLVAPMPTASTSQILGFNECFEPLTSNLYTRRVLSGEFQMVNEYLVNDLADLGVWNDSIRNQIIEDDGSIQGISIIPEELKKLYRTVWELPQKIIIDLAADRAPFIDQSQSMNIFMKDPTMGKLTSMHFYGWKKGLKTGMYYLRTQAASAAIKFTVDKSALVHFSADYECKIDITKLKKRKYLPMQDQIQSKKSKQENDKAPAADEYDIHSTTPLSCNLSDPVNCESCSG